MQRKLPRETRAPTTGACNIRARASSRNRGCMVRTHPASPVCVSVLAALRQHYSTFALVCGLAEGFQVSGYVRSFPPHIHNDTANMCLGFRLEIFISIPAPWLSRARVCTIPNKFCSHRKHSFWFGKGRKKKRCEATTLAALVR